MVRRLREIPPPVPLPRHRETLDRSRVRTDGEDGERCRMERGAGWGEVQDGEGGWRWALGKKERGGGGKGGPYPSQLPLPSYGMSETNEMKIVT
jgi:hypothetical protein